MLSFSNAAGNLFNRLGKLGLLIQQAKNYQTFQMPNMIDITDGVVAQYNAEPDLQAQMGSSYIELLNGISGVGGFAQGLAATTINRMVFRDNPQISQTLQQLNVTTSILEVIRQMKLAGVSVLAAGVTATPGTFSGTGNGIINASVRRPLDGVVLENSFSENLLLVCTDDSYLGGAVLGNEGFSVTGTGNQDNPFAFDWPLGSNSQITLNAIDGDSDNSSGNVLTNSGFESWASNVPDNFQITTGIAGTNVFEEVTIVYDPTSGGKSCRIAGDASGTLTALQQIFDDSSGTSGTLEPLTAYSFNLFIRRDGVAAAAGTLVIELVDTNGTVLQDAAGNANTFSIDLTALNTIFTSYTADFRTPILIPDPLYLRLRLSVALTDGRSVYIDKASLGQMTQMYTSGPFLAVHSGSVPFMQGDYGTCQITNSRGVGGTLSTFQTLWDQLFGMRQLDLLLPSSSSPTISDDLIASSDWLGTSAVLDDIVAGFVPLDLQTQRDAQWVEVNPGQRLLIVFYKGSGTDGDDPVVTVQQAQDSAGTGAKAFNFTELWSKQAVNVQTAGAFQELTFPATNTYTNTDAHQQLIWVVEVDGDDLDVANGFGYARMTLNDTGTNAQLGCVLYFLTTP